VRSAPIFTSATNPKKGEKVEENPFDLPAETLDQAVTKAEAILKYWRGPGGKPWRDELDACYAVATHDRKWSQSLNWRQLVAVVKNQPVPIE
jgi:hypothetical protein